MTTTYRQRINEYLFRYRQAQETLVQESQQLQRIQQDLDDTEQALAIVRHVATKIQEQVHYHLATIATKCLHAIFDEPYTVQINFQQRRQKTESLLVLEKHGMLFQDPLNEIGGGVIDVASLGLRIASIMLQRPVRRRAIILDEPFKNIRGTVYRNRTKELLLKLSQELGFQFIVNTDIEAFRLGKIVELS